jgi:hypothetical protein
MEEERKSVLRFGATETGWLHDVGDSCTAGGRVIQSALVLALQAHVDGFGETRIEPAPPSAVKGKILKETPY